MCLINDSFYHVIIFWLDDFLILKQYYRVVDPIRIGLGNIYYLCVAHVPNPTWVFLVGFKHLTPQKFMGHGQVSRIGLSQA